MCFSAQASFTASGILLLVGILTIQINKRKELKILSLMPLLFSIQQFFEGILWLTLQNEVLPTIQTISKVIFLIFAILIWPVYVSLSLEKLEKKTLRQKILNTIYRFSVIWFIGASIYMILYVPSAEICEGHIAYSIPISGIIATFAFFTYFIFTILPFFITSNRKLNYFGIAVIITAIGAYLFYSAYFTSVWCYFAAIISMFILYIIKLENEKD